MKRSRKPVCILPATYQILSSNKEVWKELLEAILIATECHDFFNCPISKARRKTAALKLDELSFDGGKWLKIFKNIFPQASQDETDTFGKSQHIKSPVKFKRRWKTIRKGTLDSEHKIALIWCIFPFLHQLIQEVSKGEGLQELLSIDKDKVSVYNNANSTPTSGEICKGQTKKGDPMNINVAVSELSTKGTTLVEALEAWGEAFDDQLKKNTVESLNEELQLFINGFSTDDNNIRGDETKKNLEAVQVQAGVILGASQNAVNVATVQELEVKIKEIGLLQGTLTLLCENVLSQTGSQRAPVVRQGKDEISALEFMIIWAVVLAVAGFAIYFTTQM